VPLALVVAGALGYVMLKSPSAPKPDAPAVASDTPAHTVPAPAAVAAATPPPNAALVLPVAATMLDGANGKERKPDPKDARNEPPPVPKVEPKAAVPEVTGKAIPVAAPVFTSGAPAVASAQPPAVAPTRTATPTPAPVPTALAAAPAPAEPPVQLAAAAPSAADAHPPAAAARPSLGDLTPISREQPAFPREAISAGVSKGSVKARVTVDASGKVISVSILESQPHRVFDRAVTNALQQWTFNAGAGTRSTDIDISFNRD
jgi:protein TonB